MEEEMNDDPDYADNTMTNPTTSSWEIPTNEDVAKELENMVLDEDVQLSNEDPFPPLDYEDPQSPKCSVIDLLMTDKNKGETEPVETMDESGNLINSVDEKAFSWEEYLDTNGVKAVPTAAFKHVLASTQESADEHMYALVEHSQTPRRLWFAKVTLTCGALLRMRWEGYDDDGSEDFWRVTGEGVHALDWEDFSEIVPPADIEHRFPDVASYVDVARQTFSSIPQSVVEGLGAPATQPLDHLHAGMLADVQHAHAHHHVWPARVVDHVGGRLRMRHVGEEDAGKDFWMFYLDSLLHPLGWAQANGKEYTMPAELRLRLHTDDKINSVIETVAQMDAEKCDTIPAQILQTQHTVKKHKFEEGQKLEALNAAALACFPATVKEIIDPFYFIVEFDDVSDPPPERPVRMCCHNQSPFIFPITWCKLKGLRLNSPPGWKKPADEFDWVEYLNDYDGDPAADELFPLLGQPSLYPSLFLQAHKMEVVDPASPDQLCAATVTRVIDHLLFYRIDAETDGQRSHIVPTDSLDVFPIGWSLANQSAFRPPRRHVTAPALARLEDVVPRPRIRDVEDLRLHEYRRMKAAEKIGDPTWSPVVYFNHKCFSGPYLSKGRVNDLPKSVGPGPVTLVMKAVIHAIIHSGYKAARVLKELALEGDPSPHMAVEMMKSRQKAKKTEMLMELCVRVEQLAEFCQRTCLRLDCCPNLVSLEPLSGECPNKCSQFIKTKYASLGNGNEKKRGRKRKNLRSGRNLDEHGTAKRGRKRRKRYKRVNLMNRGPVSISSAYRPTSNGDSDYEEAVTSALDDVNGASFLEKREAALQSRLSMAFEKESSLAERRGKRKYTRQVIPPSYMRTRGVKLPSYSSYEQPAHARKNSVSSELSSLSIQIDSHWTAPAQHNGILPHFSPVKEEEKLTLQSNPLYWDVQEAVDFIKTTDCAHFAPVFVDQEIDGQAFMLMNLPTVQEHLDLKLGPAVKLCHQIERVKLAFFEQFAY